MKKIKVGDIFEITTPKGMAYLHYIHKDLKIGRELVKVFSGLYSERPVSLDMLVSSKELYMIFFPLSAANKRKIVEYVGFYPADNVAKPKYMRDEHNVRGESLGWHIIDTDSWQRKLVKELTTEQKQFSDWGSWNDTLLINRLVEGWSLDKWS